MWLCFASEEAGYRFYRARVVGFRIYIGFSVAALRVDKLRVFWFRVKGLGFGVHLALIGQSSFLGCSRGLCLLFVVADLVLKVY